MIVANFVSNRPSMGERVAHVKSCELLEVLHATSLRYWTISSEAKSLKAL